MSWWGSLSEVFVCLGISRQISSLGSRTCLQHDALIHDSYPGSNAFEHCTLPFGEGESKSEGLSLSFSASPGNASASGKPLRGKEASSERYMLAGQK